MSKLRLKIVSSPPTKRKIRALAAHGDLTFAAVGHEVLCFRRGKLEGVAVAHDDNVRLVTVLGDHLFSIADDGVLALLEISAGFNPAQEEQSIRRIVLQEAGIAAQRSACVSITSWVHPMTYLNKLLLGDAEGSLFLLNFRSAACVHSFDALGSAVTALDQSCAVDVIGVGLADGRILIRNIKYDETLFTFRQVDGAVTGISFRSDVSNLMVTSSSSGGIYAWDLEKEQLVASLPQAHDGAICTCRFLQGEPVLLTTGADNAIRMWIFDQEDGSARLLRMRNGHSAPPTRVRYYSQHAILSAGLDRTFRIFSTIQDQQCRELSQGQVAKKARLLHVAEKQVRLPPVVDFAASPMRENDWCNVITCHADDTAAYTWRYKNAVIGKHILRPPPLPASASDASAVAGGASTAAGAKAADDPFARSNGRLPGQVVDPLPASRKRGPPAPHEVTTAKSVAISACGNFGLVGYACGRIDRYNMQSGAHRGTYWAPAPAGHASAVYGLAVDGLNETLVSGGFDGCVKLWDFDKLSLLHSFDFGSPINQVHLNTDSALAAVTGDDLKVRLIDVEARRVVRVLGGHTNRITDVVVSPDGRWVLSSSADCTVMIHDVPSGRLVDWLRFDKAVTSLGVSPAGDFVCTCHTDSVGIYLWANKTHFANVFMAAASPPDAPRAVRLPDTTGEAGDADDGPAGPAEPTAEEFPAVEAQLAPRLVTLSTLPKPVWQTLANLDAIKERNKPIQPPAAPKLAPFFLPTLAGVEPTFVSDPAAGGEGEEGGEGGLPQGSRVIKLSELRPSTRFVKLLRLAGAGARGRSDFRACVEHLSELGPSAVDLEIRSLSPADGGKELGLFIDMLLDGLLRRERYELVQAYLAAFLRVHEDTLRALPDLRARLGALAEAQREAWGAVRGRMHQVLCLVSAFSNIT